MNESPTVQTLQNCVIQGPVTGSAPDSTPDRDKIADQYITQFLRDLRGVQLIQILVTRKFQRSFLLRRSASPWTIFASP